MQQLTNEEVERVMSLYIGCDIMHEDGEVSELVGVVIDEAYSIHHNTGSYGHRTVSHIGKLLLKPLSEISDEDALWVAYLDGCTDSDIDSVDTSAPEHFEYSFQDWINYDTTQSRFVTYDSLNAKQHQFLISRGYSVPLFFAPNHWANGKTPIQLNIAINNK